MPPKLPSQPGETPEPDPASKAEGPSDPSPRPEQTPDPSPDEPPPPSDPEIPEIKEIFFQSDAWEFVYPFSLS